MTVSFKHHNSFFANLLVDVRTYFLHQTTLKAEATIGNTHTQKKNMQINAIIFTIAQYSPSKDLSFIDCMLLNRFK